MRHHQTPTVRISLTMARVTLALVAVVMGALAMGLARSPGNFVANVQQTCTFAVGAILAINGVWIGGMMGKMMVKPTLNACITGLDRLAHQIAGVPVPLNTNKKLDNFEGRLASLEAVSTEMRRTQQDMQKTLAETRQALLQQNLLLCAIIDGKTKAYNPVEALPPASPTTSPVGSPPVNPVRADSAHVPGVKFRSRRDSDVGGHHHAKRTLRL